MHASINALARHLADGANKLGAHNMRVLADAERSRVGELMAQASTSPEARIAAEVAELHADAFSVAARAAELAERTSGVIRLKLGGTFTGKAAVAPAPELRSKAAGPTVTATISAEDIPEAAERRAAWFEPQPLQPSKVHHLAPGDRLTVRTPGGVPLFTVEASRKG